jgi:hypothetical protein
MNETTSLLVSQKDSERDLEIIKKLSSPNQILAHVRKRTLQRILHLDENRRGFKACKKISSPEQDIYFSEQLTVFWVKTIKITTKTLPPEDLRAFLYWLVGMPDVGPGYAQKILMQNRDSATPDCVAHLEKLILQILQEINEQDHHFIYEIPQLLPPAQQKIIAGFIMEARWAAIDGDGESARSRLLTTRKIIKRLWQDHQYLVENGFAIQKSKSSPPKVLKNQETSSDSSKTG